jgi:hypothetical protein
MHVPHLSAERRRRPDRRGNQHCRFLRHARAPYPLRRGLVRDGEGSFVTSAVYSGLIAATRISTRWKSAYTGAQVLARLLGATYRTTECTSSESTGVGVNVENGCKLLLSLTFIAVVLLGSKALRACLV